MARASSSERRRRRRLLGATVATLLAAGVVAGLLVVGGSRGAAPVTLATFESDVAHHRVATAVLDDATGTVTGTLVGGAHYRVLYPSGYVRPLTSSLLAAGVPVEVSHAHGIAWGALLVELLPLALVVAALAYLAASMRHAGGGVSEFKKTRATAGVTAAPSVTFADVAGAEEAVAELAELRDFLAEPARFLALGATIPKGVLLFGPPGTGKTLLARAVAGEARVPFFSLSGSDFVEMFVGVGASRVRDLFEQARASAPAIIFVDEIDAVGRHRGAGLGGGHDEREQTLNQLLVELDGFDATSGVILIAATNRPDILDPALLRPGRFDRHVVVERPDRAARQRILEVHARGKPLDPSVDLGVLAARTPGFTGADLANLLNEAALLTARRGAARIAMAACEDAIDRVLAGPERTTLVLGPREKLVTAYHEAGHALVGHVLPHADPVHKVSIVARSRSLGLTFTLPEERTSHSRSELEDLMATCLGGRSAEEAVFGEPTTGAENDIEKVTRIARAMVTEYGMSDLLGPQQIGTGGGEVFLGRELARAQGHSEKVAAIVDEEVRRLVDTAHRRATAICECHRSVLDALAAELVERETLDAAALGRFLDGLPAWTDDLTPASEQRAGLHRRQVVGDATPARARPLRARPVPASGEVVAEEARRPRPLRPRAGSTPPPPAHAPAARPAPSSPPRRRPEPPAGRPAAPGGRAARKDPST